MPSIIKSSLKFLASIALGTLLLSGCATLEESLNTIKSAFSTDADNSNDVITNFTKKLRSE